MAAEAQPGRMRRCWQWAGRTAVMSTATLLGVLAFLVWLFGNNPYVDVLAGFALLGSTGLALAAFVFTPRYWRRWFQSLWLLALLVSLNLLLFRDTDTVVHATVGDVARMSCTDVAQLVQSRHGLDREWEDDTHGMLTGRSHHLGASITLYVRHRDDHYDLRGDQAAGMSVSRRIDCPASATSAATSP